MIAPVIPEQMPELISYWKHRGHIFGQCHYHSDKDLIYVNIPKNASSWTKNNLESLGFSIKNYHKFKWYDKTAIVPLRDPVERWVSGIAQYLNKFHPSVTPNEMTPFALNLIFDRVTIDLHTEFQLYFIQGLDVEKCVFFKVDENYRELIGSYLNEQGFDNNLKNSPLRNTTIEVPDKQRWLEFFQSLLDNNSKYQDTIKKYYKKDYDLINQVKFYDPR